MCASLQAITFFRDFGRIEATSNTANPKYPYVIILIRLAPFYLWLLIFTSQPHKEERFLFVAYPLVSLNASIALFLMRSWLSSAFVYIFPECKVCMDFRPKLIVILATFN